MIGNGGYQQRWGLLLSDRFGSSLAFKVFRVQAIKFAILRVDRDNSLRVRSSRSRALEETQPASWLEDRQSDCLRQGSNLSLTGHTSKFWILMILAFLIIVVYISGGFRRTRNPIDVKEQGRDDTVITIITREK
jgi:hypothetical protein